VVQLLVDSVLQCSLDGRVAVTVVTNASMLEARIFIFMSRGGALINGRWSCCGDC
jgi:hypothetical protein